MSLIEPNQDIGDTTSNPFSVCKNQQPQSAIVDSVVQSSKTTSIDPSSDIAGARNEVSCESSTQELKSSKTLVADGTQSVKGLNPYWDAQCEVNNLKLWLPIKTALQDSDDLADARNEVSSLSHSLSNKAVEKSWFSSELIYPQSKSSQTICLTSSMFSLGGCTDLEITKPKSVKPCRNKKQKQNDCRCYVFNETIRYIRSCVNFFPTVTEIKNDLLKQLPKWCDDVPSRILAKAVKEAHRAFKLAEAEPMTRAKIIKLKPISAQRQKFKTWNDCSRYVFNQTIDYIRSCVNFSPSWMEIKKDLLKRLPKWCDDTPFQIKAIAVKEAHQAYWRAKGQPKFRSRKNPTQSCYIPKSAIKEAGIYPRVSGKNLSYTEALPEEPLDGRLIYQYHEWFLSVPQKIETHVAENQGRVVSLDPGVRTFQTFYSEFAAGQIGYDDFGRLARLCFYLDDLISRTSKAKSKAKRRMKNAQARMRKKISNLIKEIHFKTARFLVDNFDVVLLPTFETSQMASKSGRFA